MTRIKVGVQENNIENALLEAARVDLANKHGLVHTAYFGIPFDSESFKRDKGWTCICEYLKEDWTVVRSLSYQGWNAILLEGKNEESVFLLKISHHEVTFDWFHHEAMTAKQLAVQPTVKAIVEILRDNSEELTDDRIETCFWYQGKSRINRRVRNLTCPTWDKVKKNYPGNYEKLNTLMKMKNPFEQGQIILWHGVPGTGKTFALRALFQEWDRIHVDVVVDPERFFNDAEYLHEVIFSIDTDEDEDDPGEWELKTIAKRTKEIKPRNKGILLVLEDAADYILASSRGPKSAPIGRLLNLTDGLIGQGIKLMVLITTNEKLGTIDPAVSRPGRCLQVLEFPKFTQEQSRKWLTDQKAFEKVGDGSAGTLADLYAKKHGFDPGTMSSEKLGFQVKEERDTELAQV